MQKVRANVTLSRDIRHMLKQYVNIRQLQGETISEGDVIEEALKHYQLRKKFQEELNRVNKFFGIRKKKS